MLTTPEYFTQQAKNSGFLTWEQSSCDADPAVGTNTSTQTEPHYL